MTTDRTPCAVLDPKGLHINKIFKILIEEGNPPPQDTSWLGKQLRLFNDWLISKRKKILTSKTREVSDFF